MKNLIAFGIAVLAFVAGPASATVIFSDDFNRADSPTVGNGWVETGALASSVAINNNFMRLQGISGITENGGTVAVDAAATQTVSNLGLSNIRLSFDWEPLGSETPDMFYVEYNVGGGWLPLFSHDLGGAIVFTSQPSLALSTASNLASVSFRFRTDVDDLNLPSPPGNGAADIEGVRIDNVVLTGDLPEPATLSLFGLGLLGLAAARRRIRRKA